MNEQEFTELAAAAALGALDADSRTAFERALENHPEWQSILDVERETVAFLADTVVEEAPRVEVKSALLSQLDALIGAGMTPSAMRDAQASAAATPADPGPADPAPEAPNAYPVEAVAAPTVQPTPVAASKPGLPPELAAAEDDADDYEVYPPRRPRLGVRLVAALAITALVAGVGAGLFGVFQPTVPESVQTIERIVQAPDVQFASTNVEAGGQVGLTWSLAEGRAVLVAQGLDPAPSGHTYELWFVRGDEKIPAGTFDPDAAGEAAVLVTGQMHEGDTVAVTVEVTGGSEDGTPSDMLVLAIPTGPAGSNA